MAVVDSRGLLYMFFGGLTAQDGARVRVLPFSNFEPSSADTNQARVRLIGWSPDGNYLAFLVDAEADDRDGVWFTNNPQQGGIRFASQVFRECPLVMTSCTVDFGGGPFFFNSLHFEWNNLSNALVIELYLPHEDHRAFTVIGLNADPTHLPPIYRYDYASWSWDGTRVLASGGGEDGLVGLRWIDPATGSIQLILNSGAHGLWLQDAVEQPNGRIVALGSTDGANSPMRLYELHRRGTQRPDWLRRPRACRLESGPQRRVSGHRCELDAPLLHCEGQWDGAGDHCERRRGTGGRVDRWGASSDWDAGRARADRHHQRLRAERQQAGPGDCSGGNSTCASILPLRHRNSR